MSVKYKNPQPVGTFGSFLDPFAHRRGSGPVRPPEKPKEKTPDFCRSFDADKLYFSRLGHSSVFLALNGKTILIDPVFSQYASPVPISGLKRFPGTVLTPDKLPYLDFVLITHNHYDHLDRKTIRALDAQVGHYIVPSGVERYLIKFGIQKEKITVLAWFEAYKNAGITIVCTPSQHGSARSPFDGNRSLWCSFVLKNKDFTVFDTGDGGFGDHFQQLHEMYGDMDLAIMECGQYNVRWHPVHMFPEESAQAARILGAKLAVPVHWGTFILSDHPWDDPPKRFSQRAAELGVPCRIPALYEILELSKAK